MTNAFNLPEPTHVYPQDGLPYEASRFLSHNGRVGRKDFEAAADLLEVEIVGTGWDIKPGDLYLAGRNTGVKLLTCKRVNERGWIDPVEFAYPYDIYECVLIQ